MSPKGEKRDTEGINALMLFVTTLSSGAPVNAQSMSMLKPAELDQFDQLVAPIALYPDTLLSQMLIASTSPLEVVAAERWTTQNKNLKGEALKKAVDQQK